MPRSVVLWFAPAENPEELPASVLQFRAARELGVKPADLVEMRVSKISFDARPRHLQWRVAAQVWLAGEEPPPALEPAPPPAPPAPAARHALIIGMGPAGIFCALELLQRGVGVTLLERGKPVQERRRDVAALNRGEPVDPDSNYAFGEGGAGTYSDGKLYTRSGEPAEVRRVLEILAAHGAPPAILTSWRPHVGSNRLPKVVEALRATLSAGGASIRFECKAVAIETEEREGRKRACGVRLASGERLAADVVVLAAGHSALDSLLMARAAGAAAAAKAFAMGVRVEHPQDWLDRHQYHGVKEHAALPPAFYELATKVRERGVYSFCMCPGGWVVPSQALPHTLVVNGMSLAKRDSPYANSGVVVAIEPKDWCGARGARWGWPELLRRAARDCDHPLLHERVQDPRGGPEVAVAEGRLPIHPDLDPLFGTRLQIALESVTARAGGGASRAPAQRADLFVAGGGRSEPLPTSYLPGLTPADFHELLPKGLAQRLREALVEFDRLIPGYAGPRGQLIGVETRTSSPVRVVRDPQTRHSTTLDGLYPCGEGAGYAGGIVSAALDGMRTAHCIVQVLVPGR